MDKNRDDIIRKLFERSLEPKERGELNNYEFINDALRKHRVCPDSVFEILE